MAVAVKRRGVRLGIIAVLVVVAAVAVTLAALPQIARRVATWRLAVATGRAVTIDAVEVRLFGGYLALRGLRVMDHDATPLATLDRLEARFSPLDLLRAHLRIIDASVETVRVQVVRTGPRTFNVSDLIGPPKPDRGPTTARFTLERFQLRGGLVTVEDRTVTPARTWRVEGMTLDIREASTVTGRPAGSATFEAVVAGAPLSVTATDLRLAPVHARATINARAIPASLAAIVWPPTGPLGPPEGVVSVTATVEHDGSTGTLVAGEVALANLELRRTGETRAFAAAPAIRVTVEGLRVRPGTVELRRLAVDGGSVTLDDGRLGRSQRWRIDGLVFEARDLSSAREAPPGTATGRAAMAGAQVSGYAANVRLAPLELHATTILRDADLSVFRVYLPATLPVQPERGVVNATVTVDHDATRGTRLGVDAGVVNLELRRPGHFVTAPALHVLANGIVLDRGQVTVGALAVTGARLTVEERTVTPARTWLVQNLVAEAKDLSSRREAVQGVASVQATVAGASASAFVTKARLEPLELYVTANLRNLDAALLRLYLPPDAPLELVRGTINAAVQVDHTVAGGTQIVGDATLTGFQARGRGVAATTTLTAPSLRVTLADGRRQGENLTVGQIELSGTGSVVDSRATTSRVDFAQLRVASEGLTWPVRAPARVDVRARFGDRGELDASGTAMLTAPLPKIAWSAELTLAFRGVDLTPLGAYVPAARGFGGRVRANVTASVAYSDALTARVRGDVAGGRFALMDGERTLLSLRRIDAKALDVQWPDRITIEQVRLREPYAVVERDRQGRFTLVDRFAPATPEETTPPPTPGATKPTLPISVGELVVESGRALVLDASGAVPARIELPRVDLTLRDVSWPKSATPARIALDAGLPGGGRATVQGTVIGEPASVDLKVVLTNAEVEPLQPYLPFRAQVRARLDANLTVVGPVLPAPRVKVQGDAGLRTLRFADGPDPLITVERIRVTGIDATWPERVTLDRVLVRGSWALIDRDRQGQFLLRALLERAPGTPAVRPPAAIAAPAQQTIPLAVRELVFEQQGATIVDAVTTPPARFDIAGARLKVNDLTWPSQGPMKIDLSSPMPGGGRLDLAGTLQLDPVRLDARAVLDAITLGPAQPYLPIEGKVAGQVSGDVAVKVGLEPLSVQVSGQTRLQRFQLNDGDRPVLTVGRVDVAGIDVDWPRRLAVESVQLRRPRLLVERDPLGQIRLWRVAVPSWAPVEAGTAPARAAAPASAGPAPAAPTIDVATFRLERASARFVDQSTTPTYAEELSDVEMTATPLSTAPGRRTRFTASGAVGGGSFKARGEALAGERTQVELTVEVHDFIVPRANPYLDLYTGWTATRGSVNVTGTYTLTGSRIETRHEVVARDVELAPVDTRDEVERRVGLPFGLLVSLLKDSRGAIKLSLPVAGDLSKREFDFQDALWGSVRALALRLVALPFSRIGSLFVSDDSKVEAVAITPVMFEPGTPQLGSGMDAHLQKIAGFLRDTPAVTLAITAIFTQADADALKASTDPTEAMRALGEHRLGAVREVLGRAGVDAARLPGRVARRPLIEGAGAPRVELNPRGQALDDPPRGG